MPHYYKKDGTPAYTVPMTSKDGDRPTTLRDARKLHLQPSVTEIINISAKPGLEMWKVNQAYLAMATLHDIEGESADARIKRAKVDAWESATKARDLGNNIHNALELYYQSGRKASFDIVEYMPIIEAVESKLLETFGEQEWIAEKSFSHPNGYGGRVDLHCPIAVVDFKCKEFAEAPKAYPEQGMQLSAYRVGLGFPEAKMVNLYISTSEPGLVVASEHERDYYPMFANLLGYWKELKQYDPSY